MQLLKSLGQSMQHGGHINSGEQRDKKGIHVMRKEIEREYPK